MTEPLSLDDLLRRGRKLRSSLQRGFAAWESGPRDSKFWPLVYLAVQVMQHHDAMDVLAERGLGLQAGILLRAMFEAAVNSMWISKDLDARLERYRDYQHVSTEKWRDLVDKWPETAKGRTGDSDEQEQVRRLAKEARQKHGFRGANYWSGTTLKDMAKDVGWLERYDHVYRMYSEVMHSSVAAARAVMSPVPTGGVAIEVGPQFDHAEACLREGYMYLTLVFEIANDCVGMDLEPYLDEAWATIPSILPGAKNIMGSH